VKNLQCRALCSVLSGWEVPCDRVQWDSSDGIAAPRNLVGSLRAVDLMHTMDPQINRVSSRSLFGSCTASTSTSTSSTSASSGEHERSASGSIAQHAMRSVRSIARIGSWAQLRNRVDDDAKGSTDTKDKTTSKVTHPSVMHMPRSSSSSSFEIGKPTPKKPYIPSMPGRATTCAPQMGTVHTVSSQSSESASSYGSFRDVRHMSTSSSTSTSTLTSHTTLILSKKRKFSGSNEGGEEGEGTISYRHEQGR
jgi:hypothetical protein